MEPRRLNVALDGETGAKLASIAERVHVDEGTLARAMLSRAIDESEPDAGNIVSLLDGIDGAWERIDAGIDAAKAGNTIPLADL